MIDVVLIMLLVWVLWWILVMFGLLTFGLGFGAMGVLPFVPFCYHFLSLLGSASATPGQRMLGLTVRREFRSRRHRPACKRWLSVLMFYLTSATSGLAAGGGTVYHPPPNAARPRQRTGRRAGPRMEALTAPREGWNMQGGTPAR